MGEMNKKELERLETALRQNRAMPKKPTGQYYDIAVKAEAVKLYSVLCSK